MQSRILKFIKLYENFEDKETLFIFDFDDTLAESPEFEDLVRPLIKENKTFQDILMKNLDSIGKAIEDLKKDGVNIYVDNPGERIEPKHPWVKKVRKPNRLYLKTPDEFMLIDESLPKVTKQWSEIYTKAENTAIVTGRSNEIRDKILLTLDNLGLKRPSLGLFCYDTRSRLSIGKWKAKTIVELLERTKFKSAKFYDDNSYWVNTVTRAVQNELPDIDFEGIKISQLEYEARQGGRN